MREGTKCHLERGKCHFESCFTGREIFQTGLNKINKVCLRPRSRVISSESEKSFKQERIAHRPRSRVISSDSEKSFNQERITHRPPRHDVIPVFPSVIPATGEDARQGTGIHNRREPGKNRTVPFFGVVVLIVGLMLWLGGCKSTEKVVKKEVIKVSNIDRAGKEEVKEAVKEEKIKVDDTQGKGYGWYGDVLGDRVRVRSCPEISMNCKTLDYVNKGDVVQVLDRGGKEYKGKLWYKVKLADGTVGWVYEEYVKKSKNKIIVKKILDRPIRKQEISGLKQLGSKGDILLVLYENSTENNVMPKVRVINRTELVFYDRNGHIRKKVSLYGNQTWEGKVYHVSSYVLLSKNYRYVMFGYDTVKVYSISGDYIGKVNTLKFGVDLEVNASILSDSPEGIFVPASYDYLYIGNAKKGTLKQIDIRGIRGKFSPEDFPAFEGYYVCSDISDDGEYIAAKADNILGLYTKAGRELWEKQAGREYGIPCISARGRYIAAEEKDGVSLYNRRGKLIGFYNHTGGDLGFSPAEKYLVVVSGNIITMYRTSDGKELWAYNYKKEGGSIEGAFKKIPVFIENGKYAIFISSLKKTGFYIFDSEKGKIGFIDFGEGEIRDFKSVNDYFYYANKRLYFIVNNKLKSYLIKEIMK